MDTTPFGFVVSSDRQANVYPVTSDPKGYVLLINIETFDNGAKTQRYGSHRDYCMLKDMWENFGYRVIEYYDLNIKEFEDAILKYVSMPELEAVDSAVVFIMSHGKEDHRNPHGILISTADDMLVSSDWIKERFSSSNCKALINKPKILFFQACRGVLQDHGVHIRPSNVLNAELTLVEDKLVPVMSDLLLVYPTLPGYVSQRHMRLGALFVQECISVFTEDSPHSDLLTMINKVDYRIRRMCVDIGAAFQVVYYESWGFNKKLYFEPPKNFKKKKRKRKSSLEGFSNQNTWNSVPFHL